MRRLKTAEVSDATRKLYKMQGSVCAVCGKPESPRDRMVLDHDHDTGIVRGALHNSCNGAEGRIKSKAHLGHKGIGPAEYVIGLGKYLEHHVKAKTRLIHPTHLTEDEKRLKRNKRARTLRARKASA